MKSESRGKIKLTLPMISSIMKNDFNDDSIDYSLLKRKPIYTRTNRKQQQKISLVSKSTLAPFDPLIKYTP